MTSSSIRGAAEGLVERDRQDDNRPEHQALDRRAVDPRRGDQARPLDDDLSQEQSEDRSPDRSDPPGQAATADHRRRDRDQFVGHTQPAIGLAIQPGEQNPPQGRQHRRETIHDRLETSRPQPAQARAASFPPIAKMCRPSTVFPITTLSTTATAAKIPSVTR